MIAMVPLLALLATHPALACTGTEPCSMPCCHPSPEDAGHQGQGAGPADCCSTSRAGTPCSLASPEFVPAGVTHEGFSAALSTLADLDALRSVRVRTRQPGRTDGEPPLKTALYLQIRTLLI
jgi:hypothetical protein